MVSQRLPRQNVKSGTAEWENVPFIDPHGFREYDARWELDKTINLRGLQMVGLGLGTQLQRRNNGRAPLVVTGRDYRSYSQQVQFAVIAGLLEAGCEVLDIGLALSPTAYFVQEQIKADGCAMITASHNPNGWTGVKMSAEPKLTHGIQEMRELREIVMNADVESIGGGRYRFEPDWAEQYIASQAKPISQAEKLKVVLACGNGTASAFAPAALRGIGVELIERHCTLDHSFPHFNPNPEDEAFMADLAGAVAEHQADLGIALDGDGDRIGFVTARGKFPSNDKAGLVLARFLAQQQPGAKFVADVKSTGLFAVDDVLQANQAETIYWKTGHSYIKRKVKEVGALAGFEKSGHFFLNHPVGPLYDDAIAGARLMIQTLLATGKTLDELLAELPTTYQSPSLYPNCPDGEKYDVIKNIMEHFQSMVDTGKTVAGQAITELITVNGVRVMLADGSWCLVRASSNIPALGVVVESPTSEAQRDAILQEVEQLLAETGKVGALTAQH